MRKMDLSKEGQMKSVKLSAEECAEYYEAIMSTDGAKIWLGTPIGDQLAKYLEIKARDGMSTKKANTQFTSFQSPIDGAEIRCNRGLREHERKHGVRQVGSDINIRTNKGE